MKRTINMKRTIYISATILSLMITTIGCTELLETAPNDQISQSIMWSTEELVDQGVIGVYYSLHRPINGAQIIGSSNNIGYYAFEAYGMAGQGEYGINGLFTAGVNAGNTRFAYPWAWSYSGIHRANNAIAQIPNAPINEKKKARLIAECKILRAFFYMRLNEIYGREGLGVPLYTEPVNPSDLTRGQSPEADVWKQIIQDLTDAINEPSLRNNDIQGEGRVSRGTAYTLRGRAYLLTGEYAKAAADFAEVGKQGYGLYPNYKDLFKVAQERCQEMIMSVQYIEEPTGYGTGIQKFTAAYQQGSQDSRGCWTDLQVTPALVNLYEVVVDANTVKPFKWEDYFADWNKISGDGTTTANRKVYFLRDTHIGGQEISTSLVSKPVNGVLIKLPADIQTLYLAEGNEARLKNAYENRDPRLSMNVVTPYANFYGVNSNSTAAGWYTYRFPVSGKYFFDQANAEPNANKTLPAGYYTSGSCNAQAEFKYIHRKFVGEGLEYMRREQNPVDEPIFRYADVLLMWAEALTEQNDLPGAMAKVKEVRDRAGVPTMAASFADQATARNYVRDERRRELIGEGVNFFDEMRWKTLKETKYSQVNPQHVWGGTENTGGTTYQWPGDFFYTWPVPKNEVELNPNLTKTPGWTY